MAQVLRDNFEDAKIDWVVGDGCEELTRGNPLIDNCYSVPLSKWKKNWLSWSTIKEIYALNKTLCANSYDVAFDAHGMFKSAVITAFCGAKKRVGYKDYREGATFAANVLLNPRSVRPHKNYHVIKRHLDMVEDVLNVTTNTPRAQLPPAKKEDVEFIDNALKHIKGDIIVFAPATTWENKHWRVENWQQLYELLKNVEGAHIVFTGISKDLELIAQITRGCEKCTILAGKTNMGQYIEVLRRAKAVVSPDSSASHLAFACREGDTPKVFTIFCATSKNTFAPPGGIAFPSGEPVCEPCHKRKCKFKHQKCTEQTSASEVFEKMTE
jgi:ADP-heptose:LPS heptosyltransferase